MRWAYGITTVTTRKDQYFPRTLRSLAAAGFDKPRLFVDKASLAEGIAYEKQFGLRVTVRNGHIGTAGNWCLALAELYIEEPTAERYAIFQDDLIACRNLRQYLERAPYPEPGYLNLYTMQANEAAIRKPFEAVKGRWYEAAWLDPDRKIQPGEPNYGLQTGRGAVALVFNLQAVVTLLASKHLVERPQDSTSGKKRVDGGIVTAMNKAGFREYVHSPSLVQHKGDISSMGSRPHKRAETFPGEDYDALALL